VRMPRPGSRWSRGRITRRAVYAAYMDSAAWQEKRREWYHHWVDAHGASPACLVGGRLWSLRTGHLHHVTYVRLGYEGLEDLIPLCATHYSQLHDLFDHSMQWGRQGRAAASRGNRGHAAADGWRRTPPGSLRERSDAVGIRHRALRAAFGQLAGPVHWPSLTSEERDARSSELADWVKELAARFDLDVRLVPPCWHLHNGMVEVLSALRDHERASYADTASPTAAVDWLRALREVEARMHELASKTQCTSQTHRDAVARVWPNDSEKMTNLFTAYSGRPSSRPHHGVVGADRFLVHAGARHRSLSGGDNWALDPPDRQ